MATTLWIAAGAAMLFAAAWAVACGVVIYGPMAVLDAPRWKVNQGVSIDIEAGVAPSVRDGLEARGHRFASISDAYMDFGAGQIIVRTDDGYIAASDPRRDGQAAGF